MRNSKYILTVEQEILKERMSVLLQTKTEKEAIKELANTHYTGLTYKSLHTAYNNIKNTDLL